MELLTPVIPFSSAYASSCAFVMLSKSVSAGEGSLSSSINPPR
jgi:hypothetical protein